MELINLVSSVFIFYPKRLFSDGSRIPLLDVFISFHPSICSTLAFPLFRNSDPVVVSVSIDFPSNSKIDDQGAVFYYTLPEWNGLLDHLRDFPWEDVFRLGASSKPC